jgi:hypothetical protein
MFKVTIEGATLEDLTTNVCALADQLAGEPEEATNVVPMKPKAETKPAKPKAETKPKAEAPKVLDFNTEVAPVVVATVDKYGKQVVVDVLDQFGAAKASDVDPSLWPELVEKLNAKVAELAAV